MPNICKGSTFSGFDVIDKIAVPTHQGFMRCCKCGTLVPKEHICSGKSTHTVTTINFDGIQFKTTQTEVSDIVTALRVRGVPLERIKTIQLEDGEQDFHDAMLKRRH